MVPVLNQTSQSLGILTRDTTFPLTVGGDVGPDLDNVRSLGSPSKRWLFLYGSSSYSQTASVALTSLSGGTTLTTGSTYPITASVANKAISASYAISASVSVTSSYAFTASVALVSLSGGTTLTTGSTYPITSSWSNNAISASYISGSIDGLIASSSRAEFALSASVAVTASYISGSIDGLIASSSRAETCGTASFAVTASYISGSIDGLIASSSRAEICGTASLASAVNLTQNQVAVGNSSGVLSSSAGLTYQASVLSVTGRADLTIAAGMKTIDSISNPASGWGYLYGHNGDKHIYWKNDTGTIFDLCANSGSSVTSSISASYAVTSSFALTSAIDTTLDYTWTGNDTFYKFLLAPGNVTLISASIPNSLVSSGTSYLLLSISGSAPLPTDVRLTIADTAQNGRLLGLSNQSTQSITLLYSSSGVPVLLNGNTNWVGNYKDSILLIRETDCWKEICRSNPISGSGSGSGTSLTTGSTYPITASWANNVISASYAVTSSYSINAGTASYLLGTSSNTLTASVVKWPNYTNTFLGYETDINLQYGNNTIIGYQAGKSSAIVANATLVGYSAGGNATTTNGGCNGATAIGSAAGRLSQNMMTSVIVGNSAADSAYYIPESVIIGANALMSADSASRAVIIGYNASVSSSTTNASNSIAIGYKAQITKPHQTVIGNPSTLETVIYGLFTSSYALTASYALNSSVGGTTLTTGSTYPITASWANNVISASYAATASYISGSVFGVIESASYAVTASYALNSSAGGTSLTTGSTYPITASWANNVLTASYISGSVSFDPSTVYQMTASNAVTASYVTDHFGISASAFPTTASLRAGTFQVYEVNGQVKLYFNSYSNILYTASLGLA